MKRSWHLALVFTLAISITRLASAQDEVPNGGFESWAAGEPTGWLSSNEFAEGTILQSTDRHSGSYSLQGTVVQVAPGFTAGPFLQCPEDDGSFPISERWGQLRGYYKFNPVGGDGLVVSVSLYKGMSFVGAGAYVDTVGTSGWQELVVDLVYFGGDTPDSCQIFMVASGGGITGNGNLGTSFWFDDLVFSADTTGTSCPITQTGDVNNSGEIVTSDIIGLVNYVLKAGPAPRPCAASGDVNCDGQVATSDIVYLVNTVLKGGPAPCDVCALVPDTWDCP